MSTATAIPTAESVGRDSTCKTAAKNDGAKLPVAAGDSNSDVRPATSETETDLKSDSKINTGDSKSGAQVETVATKVDVKTEQSEDKKPCDSNKNTKLIDLKIVHVEKDEISKEKFDNLSQSAEPASSSVAQIDESETPKKDEPKDSKIESKPKELFHMPVVSKPSIISRRKVFSFIPNLIGRPLILATHLVPSFPINLFELLAEVIEYATERPVVLLYEGRSNRPVAKGIADIAILPANDDWEEGTLLPISFVFEHRLNKDKSSCVYSDVVLVADRVSHVQEITDLRGHRCALSDRHKRVSAAHLLFDHLRSKGEGPAFFGSIVDADSHLNALQMIAGKLVEVGIVEAPVLKCHSLPGMESLRILTSLGPLPPYRFMINKSIPDILVRKITDYLSNVDQCTEWLERFAQFGVIGFAENHADLYEIDNTRSVVTSVPYY